MEPFQPDSHRSQDAATRIISELKVIQPDAETTFIQKDLTRLKHIDEVCNEIKTKETKLNLLLMTQGTMSLKGRDGRLLPLSLFISNHNEEPYMDEVMSAETSKGLDRKLTNKLPLPPPLHPTAPPTPPMRLPAALPRSLRARPRRRYRSRPQTISTSSTTSPSEKPAGHAVAINDRLRFRRADRESPGRFLRARVPRRASRPGFFEEAGFGMKAALQV